MVKWFPGCLRAAHRHRKDGSSGKAEFTASFRSIKLFVWYPSVWIAKIIRIVGARGTGICAIRPAGGMILGSLTRGAFQLHMAMISAVLNPVSDKGYRLYAEVCFVNRRVQFSKANYIHFVSFVQHVGRTRSAESLGVGWGGV